MKQTLILSIALIGAMSFTACNKQDIGQAIPSPASSVLDYNYTSSINYKFIPAPSGRFSLFHWSGGYMNANELIFDAFHQQGDMNVRERFGIQVQRSFSFSEPVVLGSVPMPAINCSSACIAIGLGTKIPARTTSSSGIVMPTYALFLSGMYNSVVDMPRSPAIPIQIAIDGPIELSTQYLYNVSISKLTYSAVITLPMDQITNGITVNMMNNAVVTNGTIFINKSFNQDLYKIIVGNLTSNQIPVQFTSQLVNVADPVSK